MTSQLQIIANKQNAHQNTCPRTKVGKTKSALNAIQHGLSAHPVFGAPTLTRIDEMAQAFAGDKSSNLEVLPLTQKAAEAQIMVEGAAVACRQTWEDAAHNLEISDRGSFGNLDTPEDARYFLDVTRMPQEGFKDFAP